ncbi:prolyl-tRNA synthetase [Aureobasidium pullulans]|nr:prolyl-tRNA synthetase [Aureobasidium pullulans]
MLPLGNRVQQKLEGLIDKHMETIGAAKVSLSTISSEELWKKTGRFVGHGGEIAHRFKLFGFHDRKDAKFLLSPTHEEEITSLVASTVQSYKDLPLRLYQIGRKFRDEARPRQGLLRGREFTMKDLYTFDITEQQARETYEEVRLAYRAFLDELRLPYLVAEADSGNIGGTLSHEYHFVSAKGEDNVISCGSCGYTINDELAITSVDQPEQVSVEHKKHLQRWIGITKDRKNLVMAWFPNTTQQPSGDEVKNEVNPNVIKALVPDIDLSVENPLEIWDKANPRQEDGSRPDAQIIEINDERLPLGDDAGAKRAEIQQKLMPREVLKAGGAFSSVQFQLRPRKDNKTMQLTRTLTGDPCQKCGDGKVKVDRAIEVGHTFHLGTRYSKPLEATFVDSNDRRVTIEMGCHGIGVSRLVGAIASMLSDTKGLNWPAAIAPFQAVVIPGKGNESDAEDVARKLNSVADTVIDDRQKPIGWKLNDADLVGYPLIVVLGRSWKAEGKAEVQCRRLGIKEEVQCSLEASSTLEQKIQKLLQQL